VKILRKTPLFQDFGGKFKFPWKAFFPPRIFEKSRITIEREIDRKLKVESE
jgi:hypothetical protein